MANGAGSGAWTALEGSFDTTKLYTHGFEDVNDSASGSQSLTAATWVDLVNDGAGSFTLDTYLLPGTTTVWDTVNNEFDWLAASYALGWTVDIRIDVDITTTGASHEIGLRLDMAHGDASEYSLEFFRTTFKAAGTYNKIIPVHLYMGDSATLNNPAKVAMYADSSGDSVVVNGWYIRVFPRNIVYSAS